MSTNSPESGAQFELPPLPAGGGEQASDQAVEQAPSKEGASNAVGVAAPPLPVPTPLPTAPPIPQTPTNIVVDTPVVTGTGLHAADADLIEKAWVEKAKEIVAKTQDDPFHQKKEISKVKAEYIQKRFNKTLKTDDTAA